jgi:hypothetical protein
MYGTSMYAMRSRWLPRAAVGASARASSISTTNTDVTGHECDPDGGNADTHARGWAGGPVSDVELAAVMSDIEAIRSMVIEDMNAEESTGPRTNHEVKSAGSGD